MGKYRYVMNPHVFNRLVTAYGSVICFLCEKPIEIGEKVVSKHTSNGKTKLYHPECLESCYVG